MDSDIGEVTAFVITVIMFNLTKNRYKICNLFNEQEPDSTELLQAQKTRQFNTLTKHA